MADDTMSMLQQLAALYKQSQQSLGFTAPGTMGAHNTNLAAVGAPLVPGTTPTPTTSTAPAPGAIGTDPNLYGAHDQTRSDLIGAFAKQGQGQLDLANKRLDLEHEVLTPHHETNLLGPAAFHNIGGPNDIFQARPGTPAFQGPNPWTGGSLGAPTASTTPSTSPWVAPSTSDAANIFAAYGPKPPAKSPLGSPQPGMAFRAAAMPALAQ